MIEVKCKIDKVIQDKELKYKCTNCDFYIKRQ